jgi:hypothetical protein
MATVRFYMYSPKRISEYAGKVSADFPVTEEAVK